VIQHIQRIPLVASKEMVQPGFRVPWSRARSVATLRLAVQAGSKLSIVLKVGKDAPVIFDGPLKVNLTGLAWGVTAQTDVFASRFDLKQIKVTVAEAEAEAEAGGKTEAAL
jgi:hypothetical protein